MSDSISKTKTRTVEARFDMESGRMRITERTAYLPYGYQRRKWNIDIVSLSLEELNKITALTEKEVGVE